MAPYEREELRDKFAIIALHALIVAQGVNVYNTETLTSRCLDAYKIADEMLKTKEVNNARVTA